MSHLKFSKAYMKSKSPRLDVIEFVGQLEKKDLLVPQIAEYTYTGKETIHQFAHYHRKNVNRWTIEKSISKDWVMEILETKGNYIKFQFKVINKDAWSSFYDKKGYINLRVNLFAHMTKPGESGPTRYPKYVSSKTSKVYHKPVCSYCKRIKNKVNEIKDKRNIIKISKPS